MLPATARLRQRAEFTATVRRGRRGRSGLLAVHLGLPANPSAEPGPTRVGFVVARSVGSAVVRNRVLRRLRHLMAARIERLPRGSRVVVRAMPAAATATSAVLAEALDRALRQAVAAPRSPTPIHDGQVTSR